LSALKYEILLVFAIYALLRFWHKPTVVDARFRILCYVSGAIVLTLSSGLLLRMLFEPGVWDETTLCALQFVPWIGAAFLVPLVVTPAHSTRQTLLLFERLMFWVSFPFWLVTIALAMTGIRYPNLSYPGVLMRFGGIIDDPNGYACLILMMMALCGVGRTGAWKSRMVTYFAMVLGTLSFAGYISAVVMCVGLFLLPRQENKRSLQASWTKVLMLCALTLGAAIAAIWLYRAGRNLDALTAILSAKSTSASDHVSDLWPDPATLEYNSATGFFFGIGGFSENLYWRILLNFGWAGLVQALVLIAVWTSQLFFHGPEWRRSIGLWCLGLLVGANGIAYLLTFPINLLYWSVLALIVYTAETSRGSESVPSPIA
jgi:hypothetical protein